MAGRRSSSFRHPLPRARLRLCPWLVLAGKRSSSITAWLDAIMSSIGCSGSRASARRQTPAGRAYREPGRQAPKEGIMTEPHSEDRAPAPAKVDPETLVLRRQPGQGGAIPARRHYRHGGAGFDCDRRRGMGDAATPPGPAARVVTHDGNAQGCAEVQDLTMASIFLGAAAIAAAVSREPKISATTPRGLRLRRRRRHGRICGRGRCAPSHSAGNIGSGGRRAIDVRRDHHSSRDRARSRCFQRDLARSSLGFRSIVHALRGWPTPLGIAANTTTKMWGRVWG